MHLKLSHFLCSCRNVSNTDGNNKLFKQQADNCFQCLSNKEEQRKQYNYQAIHDFGKSFLPSTRLLSSTMSQHHMTSTQQLVYQDFWTFRVVPTWEFPVRKTFFQQIQWTWTHSKSVLEESSQVLRLYFCQYLLPLLFSTRTVVLKSKPAQIQLFNTAQDYKLEHFQYQNLVSCLQIVHSLKTANLHISQNVKHFL